MFLTASAFAIAISQPANILPKYRAAGHGFSVRLGDKVKVESKPHEWQTGQVYATVYSSFNGPILCQVAVTPIPEAISKDRTTAQILAFARDGTQTMARLKVDAEQDLFVGGFPAKRFMVRIPNGPVSVQMIILRSGQLFHVLAITPPDKSTDGVAFIKSFEFLPRTD